MRRGWDECLGEDEIWAARKDTESRQAEETRRSRETGRRNWGKEGLAASTTFMVAFRLGRMYLLPS
jgi:hypothetical protein